MALDDKDEFEVDWEQEYFNFRCPACGGFREEGCSTCAHYMFVCAQVDKEMRPNDHGEWPSLPVVHAEAMRRIEAASAR